VTTCKVAGKLTPIRLHGMLDDASRYVVALEAVEYMALAAG
jgi:putative transposase